MRQFVTKSTEGGRCASYNQYYKSAISDEVFNIFSKELKFNGNLCENLDNYFEFTKNKEKF